MASPDIAVEMPAARAFRVEQHGFDFIPLNERTMTLRGAAFFWAGTQANLLPVTLGALPIALGLGFWQAILAVVIGNLFFAFVAVACLAGPRAGVPTMTFTRATFGIRGNTPNVALTWISCVCFEVLNTVLAALAILAFLPVVGVASPGLAVQIVAVVAVVAAGAVIALFGHGLMIWIQRIAAVVLIVAIVLVFIATIGGTHWGLAATVPTSNIVPLLTVAIAANAAGPISYFFNAPEWFRYLPRDVNPRKLGWTLGASGASVSIALCVLGAVLASQVSMADPLGGPSKLLPTPIYLVFLGAAVLGTIANNVPTLYSSGLTLQALGLPIKRLTGTFIDGVVSTVLAIIVVLNGNLLSVINVFVALLIVWLGPFGATWIADALVRRYRWDPVDLHDRTKNSQYWGVAGWRPDAWIACLAGIAVALLTIDSSVWVGPISALLGGTDLSWFLPMIVSFVVYLALSMKKLRTPAQLALGDRAIQRQNVEHETEREVLANEHKPTTA